MFQRDIDSICKEYGIIKPGNKNKLFFLIKMMSGDADAFHDHEISFSSCPELKGINFNNLSDHLPEVEDFYEKLKILAGITDVNDDRYLTSCEEVEEKYGKLMASLYDKLPNDITTDDGYKAAIDEISLIGYSSKNVKHICFLGDRFDWEK